MSKRGQGRRVTMRGVVRSANMDRTIAIDSERLVKHPRFHKYVRRKTRYYAHDAKNEATEGDYVEIVWSKPLSKTKRWKLAKILTRSGG